MKKRAIISVSDKNGIVEFARGLHQAGIELISTGGTAALLAKENIPVIEASEITQFPECLDGRVKTLHPKIHGGILAMRDNKEHMDTIASLGIEPIDFIIINLYPFKETIQKENVEFEECIENIDIGGPSMLRAAAKNHKDVTVITDPKDYEIVLDQIKTNGATDKKTRFELAKKVFEHTAAYDTLIANYLLSQSEDKSLPEKYSFTYEKVSQMRYGENPHQSASFYKNFIPVKGTLPLAKQLGGKELSYNNIADTDACISLLKEFDEPTVVAVKHANPCGVGSADNLYDAWVKAYEADSVSIFGGIVAANREIDEKCALEMSKIFLEVIVAPSFSQEALNILKQKKNLRILHLPDVEKKFDDNTTEVKFVGGGLLVQEKDVKNSQKSDWKIPTKKKITKEIEEDLEFGMKVVKHVKSNAIVLVKNKKTVGIGPGQPNRITAAMIAIDNAKENAKGSVMASDAFFPFPDCVKAAADAECIAIIQPGGSIKDEDSIKECDKNNLPMVFTGMRHFKH